MKTLEELQAELAEADKECEYWRQRRYNQVGNCPSDVQGTDMAWRKRNGIAAELSKLIRAKEAACKHRWEETESDKFRTPGAAMFKCKKCNCHRFAYIGVDHAR